jgi:hypothetical protein
MGDKSLLERWERWLEAQTVSPWPRDYPETLQTDAGASRAPVEGRQTISISEATKDAHSTFLILLGALVILTSRITGDEAVCIGTATKEGKPFVLHTTVEASETFETLLLKIKKVYHPRFVLFEAIDC